MYISRLFQFAGVSEERVRFGICTAMTAWLAVALATALHIPNAHWAGITVFTVSQPTRGLLAARCISRLVGTAAGAAAGVVILLCFADHPTWIVLALTLWLAACAATSAVLRHFRSYGAVLAGYTCAIVALIDVGHRAQVGLDAFGRIGCTLIGVISATLVARVFMPPTARDALIADVTRLTSDTLNWSSDAFTSAVNACQPSVQLKRIIFDISKVEAQADEVFDGSIGAQWRKRQVRNLATSLMALIHSSHMLVQRYGQGNATDEQTCAEPTLTTAASEMLAGASALLKRDANSIINYLAPELASGFPDVMRRDFLALRAALEALLQDFAVLGTKPPKNATPLQRYVPHRDWLAARRGAIRTGLCVLFVGTIWQMTQWSVGSTMLLGSCVYIAVFASNEDSRPNARRAIFGVVAGICAGWLYRLVLHSSALNIAELQMGLLPFMALSAAGLSTRFTAISTVEYSNFFLMLVQPSHLDLQGPNIVRVGLALLAGVCLAVVTLHFLLPIDSRRRQRIQGGALRRDLERLANDGWSISPSIWHARTYQQMLRWIARPTMVEPSEQTAGALALLDVGELIFTLRGFTTTTDEHKELVARALAALGKVSRDWDSTVDELRSLAIEREALQRGDPLAPLRKQLLCVADELAGSRALFYENDRVGNPRI